MIYGLTGAFNGMSVTARVKHATYFDRVPELNATKIEYVFTDAHNVTEDTEEWQWEDDYSSATLTLKCSDTRCSYQETYDATVTSKSTDGKITYTATVEAMGETYTDTREYNNYKITTLDSAHGKVETNVQQAREGDQVTVTSVPDEGYHLGSVSVVKDTRVPLTYVMGGSYGYENEKGEKLVDGNKTTNWRQGEGHWTVFMKADSKVRMAGYSLTTGNTVAVNPGSNWKKWTIYGGNFGSDTEIISALEEYGWTPIATVENDTVLQAENNQTYDFTLSTPAEEYQYYLIRVFESRGADFIQMSEFELKTEEESVALTGGGFTMPAYPVIVSATFEPNMHTVTWLNEDGTELDKDENVPYGSKPAFNGTTPTKTGFTFMGWKDGEEFYAPDELPEVTKDVTYTAVFGAGDGLGSELAGHSISLEGDIAVNFYMELSDFVIAHKETAYMRFAVPGENGATEQKEYVRDAKIKEVGDKTYYAFKCRVAAKEMTSDIQAQLIDGTQTGKVYTYSVKQYADYLLSNASVNPDYEKAVPLVKKMLNYGAYAQLYFDRNADNLANKDLPDADKALGNVKVNAPQTDVSLPKGVSFEGSTLSLKSETTLSLYFTSNATLSFSAGDKTVETATSGNYQIARIRGIAASELKDSFTLTVTAGEETGRATYSPMNYCGKILNDGTDNEALSNVTKALVLYAQAANEYFSPTS